MSWIFKKFNELSVEELYAILKLRIEVFIVEQKCIFQDADGKDAFCYHLMKFQDGELAAYSRLVPAGRSFPEISIGRVITSSQFRKSGLGKELMEKSIATIWQLFGKQPIRIGAQLYLYRFYNAFGFIKVSEVYIEDDIEHIEMLLTP